MNRPDFEKWMREKVEGEDYIPAPGMWDKLQTDLKEKKTKRKILLLPVFKIAASVALLISAGYIILLQRDDNAMPVKNTKIAQSRSHKKQLETAKGPILALQRETVKSVAQKQQKSQTPANTKTLQQTDKKDITTKSVLEPEPNRQTNNKGLGQKTPNPMYSEPTPYYLPYNEPSKKSAVGVSAHIGSPGLGTVGYQVGIVGRHNLSNRVFVEATVAIASTAINLERSYSFTSVNLGSEGLTNSFEKTTTNVHAKYARSVIAVGTNPSMGVKLSNKFSISGGLAIYRNITPSLLLTNENEFGEETLTNNVVNQSHQIGIWDIGVTGNADYKINTKLSFNVNYRKGVTNYYLYDNKGYKNSMFNVGVKYMFSGRKE